MGIENGVGEFVRILYVKEESMIVIVEKTLMSWFQ